MFRYWLRRFTRRFALGPTYCQNCGALSFTHWLMDGWAHRWDCDECGITHAITFGGSWKTKRTDDAEE